MVPDFHEKNKMKLRDSTINEIQALSTFGPVVELVVQIYRSGDPELAAGFYQSSIWVHECHVAKVKALSDSGHLEQVFTKSNKFGGISIMKSAKLIRESDGQPIRSFTEHLYELTTVRCYHRVDTNKLDYTYNNLKNVKLANPSFFAKLGKVVISCLQKLKM